LETSGSEAGTICLRRLCQEPDTSLSVIQRSTKPGLRPASAEKRTVIDRAWELVAPRPSRSKNKSWSFAVPSRRESTRDRERLQSAAPICDDASLLKLDEEVAEYVREAKRRDALGPDELVLAVVDAVARNYFRRILRKQARVTPLRSRTRS
jgi:hypothetical protein